MTASSRVLNKCVPILRLTNKNQPTFPEKQVRYVLVTPVQDERLLLWSKWLEQTHMDDWRNATHKYLIMTLSFSLRASCTLGSESSRCSSGESLPQSILEQRSIQVCSQNSFKRNAWAMKR
ncbi:hypothetical protein CDAR_587451 [Caerostris darwini]|uniref:Uncharacterized protein n=1 Tax=Caerostris darwini TaxID=1538125 RepID=A0AAV4SJ19_9ARAC|nr:hypothetical protein CDAR_587451 [Caerostris darwini]